MEDDDHLLLEVTLISAQGLKPPFTSNLRRLQTYAVTYIHPSAKLRTRTDRISSDNPTWNDKFLFRVPPSFLSADTSAITIDVFASGILKDPLLGSVRILLSTFSSPSTPPHLRFRSPAFAAFQIRRPSGRFQGVLNVAAMVVDGSDLGSLRGAGLSAIAHRDLIGKKGRRHRQKRPGRRLESGEESGFSGGESTEMSDADGGESTTSTSSAASTMSTSLAPSPRILREMNGEELERKEGGRILCWLGKMHISPSDENIRVLCPSEQTKRL